MRKLQLFALAVLLLTTWWAIGNFREDKLHHIMPGMPAEVYVLAGPNLKLSGVVESIGFGVTS